MSVTVVKRPTGHKIIDQAIEAAITDSAGDALITFPYHGLGTGDTIYITSDIDEYNGFWYVTSIDSNTFKISEYATADFVEYYQDLDIEFYQTNPHDWNSVFLPIIYKCSNNRWPVNTFDTVRTISSFSDDNGYTHVITSGTLKLSAAALDFAIISGSSNEDLNGVWQIVESQFTEYTLDLPYDASNDLVGASIQFYYNNFQVGIKIFGGLPASHPWQAKKPFVEVAELSLTPDENNIVMFSVAGYIKSKVAIKNNITLFSLPLNLDAFTGFYISINESYDRGDGYTINRTSSDFEEDTFEGYAIAGKLPFKNVYSGDYADYVYTDSNPASWLTVLDRLLAVEGKYFDVSFIKNVDGPFTLTINKYVSDYLTTVEIISYADQGIGVYRLPIEFDSAYDSYCVYVTVIPSEGEAPVVEEIDSWANAGGPFPGVSWDYATFGYPWASVNGGGGVEGYTAGAVATVAGTTYTFTMVFEVGDTGTETPITKFIVAILDAAYNEVETIEFDYTTDGLFLETFNFTPTSNGTYLALRAQNDTPTQTKNFYLRFAAGGTNEQLLLNTSFADSSVWTNEDSGTSWVISAGDLTLVLASGNSKKFTQIFAGSGAGTYLMVSSHTDSNFNLGVDSLTLAYSLYDEDDNLITQYISFITSNGTSPVSHGFTSLVPIVKIEIIANVDSGSDVNILIPFVELYAPLASDPGIEAQITEEICIDIIESCEAQGGFVPTDIRLLEDGSYRLLE